MILLHDMDKASPKSSLGKRGEVQERDEVQEYPLQKCDCESQSE